MNKKPFYFISLLILSISILIIYNNENNNKLPVVAIANYGPNASLSAAIAGFKQQMEQEKPL